ncbi:LCP family protein [candidate division WWE3 bacterium]|nr:LCP family protein [candidate division WWE3 bacterium]
MLNNMNFNNKKIILLTILTTVLVMGGIFLNSKNWHNSNDLVSGIVKIGSSSLDKIIEDKPLTADSLQDPNTLNKEIINILLVGTDSSIGRRARGQRGFNTDSIILVSVNQKTKRVLLTSVPRDLWINDNKINALYIVFGEDTLTDAFYKITGLKVDRVIRADFDGFKWVIDALGGVNINVERSFTDTSYPNNQDSAAMTVEFTAGNELMNGERALIFARSRKGSNGEGSDLMRAKRQHLILQALVDSVSQPTSKYQPMDIKTFFEAAQSLGDIYTNLTLDDAKFLWSFYKNRVNYSIESFVIGSDYLYHPGMYPQSDFHAWVFVPIEEGFKTLHEDVLAKLNGTFVDKIDVEDSKIDTKSPPTATPEIKN